MKNTHIPTTTQYLSKYNHDIRFFRVGLLGFDESPSSNSDTEQLLPQKVLNKIRQFEEIREFRGVRLKSVSAGGYHCCVLTYDGQVYCWGWNKLGQLGVGDYRTRFSPTKLKLNFKVSAIKSGGRHTMLLSEDGRLYTFGCGSDGRLGHGDTSNQPAPVEVKALRGYRVTFIGTGFWHSIVGTADRKIFVFGNGDEGKLGLGDRESRLFPTEIVSLRGLGVISAMGGAWHTLLVTEDRRVFSWGSNYWGQLGISEHQPDAYKPVEITFFRGKNVKEVVAGSNFSLCLTEDGFLYSFGCGSNAKTCHGSSKTLAVPVRVETINFRVKSVVAGSNHTVLLDYEGNVYSCGWCKYAQLGHGDFNERPVPTKIEALKGVEIQTISAGAFFTVFASNTVKEYSSGLNFLQCIKNYADTTLVFA